MSASKLHFQLPKQLKAEDFIRELADKVPLQAAFLQSCRKTYYDSFDWRLYAADLLCELNQSKTGSELRLLDLQNNQAIVAVTELDEVSVFAEQFQDEAFGKQLAPLLEMRALMPVISVDCQTYQLNLLDKQQKTTVRLLIEDYDLLPTRVHLQPLKGYDKAAKRITRLLKNELGLKKPETNLLQSAMELQGRQPLDYASKFYMRLESGMRADIACKLIYSHLLETMRVNEQGTINAVDSEFLHDFRVAVRRTRSGLSQLPHILPDRIESRSKVFFAWLGQITSLARDLDVYLLNFSEYQRSLPVDMQAGLEPLYDFIQRKQIQAYRELAAELQSPEYLNGIRFWDEFLNEPVAVKPTERNARLSIKQIADARIYKVYQRVLKQGLAISELSPAEALHDLRKTCKKLRYLMEFFQSLYPAKEIADLIKILKNFQNVLGDFQDYEVQAHTLKSFADEMAAEQIAAETLIAMGVLMQNLHVKREQARQHFAGSFTQFNQAANVARFEALFATQE